MAHERLRNFSYSCSSQMVCACLLLLLPLRITAQAISFDNKGAVVIVKEDAVIIIKSSARNSGYFGNESTIIIEGNFTNNDTTEGIGMDTFAVKGNWFNNATFIAGQSTVLLYDSNQTIGGTSITTFHNLTLAGTGLKSLSTVDAVVSNHLALNDREFSTGAKKLSISTADVNAISRTTGFVSSQNGGKLERLLDDSLGYLFPLGSTVGTFRYRPLMMATDSGTVSMAARFANADATVEGFNRSIRSDEICDINPLYYHQIERTQGLQPVNVTMFFDSAADGNWTQIAHWQTVPRWEMEGLASEGLDTVFKTLTASNLTNFNFTPFALMTPIPLLDTTQTVILNVSCNSGNDGSICVSNPPITGTAPFQYWWSTGDTTACITGLAVGTYSLTIIDGNNCSNTYSFFVNEPNGMVITSAVTDVSCKGGTDGSVCISVTGDFPPFGFNWSLGGGGNSCLTGLEAGFYRV
ncbi:MAG TPA: SprB repeat-containing protein, partial [Chitinophagales bacterium]|nr:SprB repeat-containing protein [Chitinophagales bacterium]